MICGMPQIVFSSSATVYGEASDPPFQEDDLPSPLRPHKLFIEDIVRDWTAVEDDRSSVILRYFNPIGADVSGLIGETKGIPNNLMPLILDVAIARAGLSVFGDDYDTPDGTGVRDYIHVDDLARGHISALDFMGRKSGTEVFNLVLARAFQY